jgi:hypothetical protein
LRTLGEVIVAVKQTAMSIEQLRAQVLRWQRAPKYVGGAQCDCPTTWLLGILDITRSEYKQQQ